MRCHNTVMAIGGLMLAATVAYAQGSGGGRSGGGGSGAGTGTGTGSGTADIRHTARYRTAGDEPWRYRYHENRWWYWMPAGGWVYHSSGKWIPFDPGNRDDSSINFAREVFYEGTWKTTNRVLDGTMTCKISQLNEEEWRGRFAGVWQGVPFDYTVTFSGPASQLQGKATIDGAEYLWTGAVDAEGNFMGRFGGSRYEGHFKLTRAKTSSESTQQAQRVQTKS